MSTSSSQPREWEILPLAGSTAEDFTANEPLPPQTTVKAKAAEHFFSDKLLLSGSSARLPTPAPAGEQLQAYAFKSLGSAGRGLWEQTRPVLQRRSTQTFPPSHSRTAARPELPRTCQGRARGNAGCATQTWTCTAFDSFPESLLLPRQHWTFFPQTSSLRQIFGV